MNENFNIEVEVPQISTAFVLAVYCAAFFRGEFNPLAARLFTNQCKAIGGNLKTARKQHDRLSAVKEEFEKLSTVDYISNGNKGRNLKQFYYTLENYFYYKKRTEKDTNELTGEILDDVIDSLSDLSNISNLANVEFIIKFNVLLEDIMKYTNTNK